MRSSSNRRSRMLYLAIPQTNAVACVKSHTGRPEFDLPHVLSEYRQGEVCDTRVSMGQFSLDKEHGKVSYT